jgi:hypothetical protein
LTLLSDQMITLWTNTCRIFWRSLHVMALPFPRHLPTRLLLPASDGSQVEQTLDSPPWAIATREDLWSFPCSDHASVGVATQLGAVPPQDLWHRVDRFLTERFPGANRENKLVSLQEGKALDWLWTGVRVDR